MKRLSQRSRGIALAALVVVIAGCSGGNNAVTPKPAQPTANQATLRDQVRELAHADHNTRYAEYLRLVAPKDRRCRAATPKSVVGLVSTTYQSLISYRGQGLSRLSVLRSLAAGVAPKGPLASCTSVAHALVAELSPSAGSGSAFSGYGAPTTVWAAHHTRDPHGPGYLPKLPNGTDSFAASGVGHVTYVARNFDPPVSQALALASIGSQLLPPGHLKIIYSLDTASNCSETIYLNAGIEHSIGSDGVMVELTSGHGITSHYDTSAINHARLTIGRGRLGGEPCV